MRKILILYQITRKFGQGPTQVIANQDISLEVADGEKIILQGPSGSGKTTLLLIIGCLLKPTSGRIFLEEQELTQTEEKDLAYVRLKSIGFVFQSFNLLPLLTAKENITLPARFLGLSQKEANQRAEELLQKLGLANRGHHLPANLSGGEKQRAAVARSLINNPALVLADEPTANLDSQSGRQVIKLLCEEITPDCGRSIIIASHDQRIVPFVDRVVTIEDGKIKSDKRQITSAPATF